MLGKALATLFGILALAFIVCLGKLYEYNDLNSILVVRSLSGHVTTYFDTGYKWQGWGRVSHYNKSGWLNFNPKDGGTAITVRFAEGGHGDVAGSCRYELPLDEKHMVDIQQTFGSQEALERQLLRQTAEKAMFMSGPLMTSAESYSLRRADLINIFEDQAANGVVKTVQAQREIDDPLTHEKKWIAVKELKLDKNGQVERQEISPLIRFGIKLYGVAVVGIQYEQIVEDQIKQQQTATIAVQIAKANSLKAEQDAITVEKQGQASAAKAKWDQEVLKATAVTQAEQEKEVATTIANKDRVVAETAAQRDLNVAKLARETADNLKAKLILEGEGESTKRKLIMAADGALAIKLDAYKQVSAYYAQALSNFKGNLVPSVVFGGGNGTAGNSAPTLIDLLAAKTAKELALDMSFQGSSVNR